MVRLIKEESGFEYLEVQNNVCSAKIALQGAHIYEHKRKGLGDILWVSESSEYKLGSAIRGGVPICWPRFGNSDKRLPAHGFSRTALFELGEVREIDVETTELTLILRDDEKSRKIWNYSFKLEVIFRVSEALHVSMKTTNTDTKDFMITQALHTYFNISDIDDVKIEGLENREYLDTLNSTKNVQNGVITISSECDRVYQDVRSETLLKDKNRVVKIDSKGSSSTVVWNPWVEKGSKMSGMKADAYREFVCIETANAFEDSIVIRAGESHTLGVTLQ